VWDIAAGVLLVEEAGGVALTIDGEPLLPLAPDQQQDGRSAMTIAGPDADYVRDLADALFR
jgi:fructose-1,6-bisphosphatase/inositol monophosphatase family enzyme